MSRAAGAPGTAGGGYRGEAERQHELKTWPGPFSAVLDGSKPYEIRPNDRGFCIGDRLRLREWDPDQQRYTGREVARVITHVLPAGTFGLRDGHVALGLSAPAAEPTDGLREQIADLATELTTGRWDAQVAAAYQLADALLAGPLADLLAKLQAVEALHVPVHGYCVVCDKDRDVEAVGNNPACTHRQSFCRGCDFDWPCPTSRALDGQHTTDEEGR